MKVTELGEAGLIDLLAKTIGAPADKNLIISIGDDTAAWHGDNGIQLATVDSLVQNVHFTLGNARWEDLGWKALAVNLSDIAAMGGTPRYALVALALLRDTEVEQAVSLYRGMQDLAQQHNVNIIGGDTDCAPFMMISVTVLGKATGKHLLTRSSAQPGDKIAVTGSLGGAAGGLRLLADYINITPEHAAILKESFWRPQPRVAEGQLLVRCGVKTAMDISDGLASDLGHICRSSGVSARVEVARVPVNPAVQANFGDKAREMALAGGEDYELLFTAGDEIMDKVRKALPCPVTVIGEITAGSPGEVNLLDETNRPVVLPRSGWHHFEGK
ncbi:MAG: thiamine-phosphate kinase [Dehalococcoidales bacterium]|nr:thiamine-phosphate kinase [Dehalococcoidales bacterium]